MRQRLLIGAVAAMTALSWYAVYRTVRFTIAVATELGRASTLTSLAARAQTTIVLDRHGQPAFAFHSERRIDVTIDQVSPHMLHAVVAVEDRRFHSHYGLDPIRIAGAALRNARAGRVVEGGSTITQQLARAVRLSPARTFERKLREAMLALRLEERYSKAQILQEYLNTVYFGEGFYGVEAASRGYFGKPAAELAPAEAALLAALVRAPSRDAPCVSIHRATRRRNLVLGLMEQQGFITAAERSEGIRAPLPDRSHTREPLLIAAHAGSGEYFQEEVRRQLVSMFGPERVLRGGLRCTRPTNHFCSVPPSRRCGPVSPNSPKRGAAPRTSKAVSWRSTRPAAMSSRSSVAGTLARAHSTGRRRPGVRLAPRSSRSSTPRRSSGVTLPDRS